MHWVNAQAFSCTYQREWILLLMRSVWILREQQRHSGQANARICPVKPLLPLNRMISQSG